MRYVEDLSENSAVQCEVQILALCSILISTFVDVLFLPSPFRLGMQQYL